jgi:hypothetical protein
MTRDIGNEHDAENGPLTRQSMTQVVRAAFAVAQTGPTPRLVKADEDKGWEWKVEMASTVGALRRFGTPRDP